MTKLSVNSVIKKAIKQAHDAYEVQRRGNFWRAKYSAIDGWRKIAHVGDVEVCENKNGSCSVYINHRLLSTVWGYSKPF